MLTSMRIKNFKAWIDTGNLRMAPLTVLFGGNSAGKSSIGHLLLALKQTVLSPDRKTVLHLGDQNALIDLGTLRIVYTIMTLKILWNFLCNGKHLSNC